MDEFSNPPVVVLKQRRTVFENSKFLVHADHISDAAGREVLDYLVVAPRIHTDALITGVTVLPVVDRRIVLNKTFRHAVRSFVLETARGFVDPSETPAEAALRELTEETGLVCSPDRLVAMGTCFPEASTLQARVALFAALDCARGPRTDHSEVGLGESVSFSLEEAESLLQDMALEDVTTLLCLHRFFLMRESGLL
ncbi:MAG TPA: NUDIX hydrolase [Terriglobia bacterium]|nr:NUDIX hydrolase [Terriglobia bacterium]